METCRLMRQRTSVSRRMRAASAEGCRPRWSVSAVSAVTVVPEGAGAPEAGRSGGSRGSGGEGSRKGRRRGRGVSGGGFLEWGQPLSPTARLARADSRRLQQRSAHGGEGRSLQYYQVSDAFGELCQLLGRKNAGDYTGSDVLFAKKVKILVESMGKRSKELRPRAFPLPPSPELRLSTFGRGEDEKELIIVPLASIKWGAQVIIDRLGRALLPPDVRLDEGRDAPGHPHGPNGASSGEAVACLPFCLALDLRDIDMGEDEAFQLADLLVGASPVIAAVDVRSNAFPFDGEGAEALADAQQQLALLGKPLAALLLPDFMDSELAKPMHQAGCSKDPRLKVLQRVGAIGCSAAASGERGCLPDVSMLLHPVTLPGEGPTKKGKDKVLDRRPRRRPSTSGPGGRKEKSNSSPLGPDLTQSWGSYGGAFFCAPMGDGGNHMATHW